MSKWLYRQLVDQCWKARYEMVGGEAKRLVEGNAAVDTVQVSLAAVVGEVT